MKKLLLTVLSALLFVGANLNGQAVALDGDQDFVDLGNDPSLHIDGKALTLEAWIFVTEFQEAGFWAGVIMSTDSDSEPTGAADGYMIRCGGNGQVDFTIGPKGPDLWVELTSDEEVLELNTWYHIAGVYDGTNMILYVDGLEIKRLDANFDVGPCYEVPLLLGESPSWRGRTFEGLIDEARVWSVARTPAEIFENKDKELCIADQTGLEAYYKMNEGEGTALTDESGNNNGLFGGHADSTDYHPLWVANGSPVSETECGPSSTIENVDATDLALGQSFPNPASGITTIPYTVENGGLVSIKLYNLLGEEVHSVVNNETLAGEYTASFNARNLAKGVYFYKMTINGELIDSKKLIVR